MNTLPDVLPENGTDHPELSTLRQQIAELEQALATLRTENEHLRLAATMSGENTSNKGGDETDHKQTEEALHTSPHFVQRITDTIPGVVYIYDLIEKQYVYSNRQIADMLGYTVEDVQTMGGTFMERILHPDDQETRRYHMAKQARLPDNTVLTVEYRARHRDGTWRWLLNHEMIFARTADGQVHQILGMTQDVTNRKRTEMQLQFANEQLIQSNARLHQRTHEVTVLNQMGNLLQNCRSVAEAYKMIAIGAEKLFTGYTGVLYIRHAQSNQFDAVAVWGGPLCIKATLSQQSCQAVQQRRDCFFSITQNNLCPYIAACRVDAAICVPLTVRDETMGILHLRSSTPMPEQARQCLQQLANVVARQISLALINLTLREQLHVISGN